MMSTVLKSLAAATAFASVNAFAYDFTAADALYAKRGDSAAAIDAARAAYRSALPTVTGAEKVKAYEFLARLDYYEGAVKATDNGAQKTIFDRCLNDIKNIEGETRDGKVVVEYYYWKGTCLASWAKANGVVASLFRLGELLDTLKKGREIAPLYEGNGFDRIAAPVYAKIPAIAGGSLESAYNYVESTINSPGYTGVETDKGKYFFVSYQYKAEILAAQGKKADAIEVLTEALSRIEDADYAPDRVPETIEQGKTMEALKAELSK